jgi:hypothetical protein
MTAIFVRGRAEPKSMFIHGLHACGAKTPHQTSAVELLLGAMTNLPLEDASVRKAAEIRRHWSHAELISGWQTA